MFARVFLYLGERDGNAEAACIGDVSLGALYVR